jgi:LysR family transcriptional regulator, low CO2-responsive transcriptional regulator
MRGVTLQQLRLFASAAKHLSFARAADELHVTQPAVSMQIRGLEDQVGLPLFDRASRQVSLTTPGEYFLVYARRMLSTLKDAEDAMARMRGVKSGRLLVGLVTTAEYFLPRLLAHFLREHPGIDIQLAIGNRQSLVKMLQGNEVELAVMGRPPKELETRAEPFARHPNGIVAAPGHRFARLSNVPAQLLSAERFIVREQGSGTRAAMEQFFQDHHVQPGVAMEVGSNEAIKHAVAAGLGISFLSLHTVHPELQQGEIVVVAVEGTPIVRSWYVVHTLAKTLSPAAEAFRYFMLEEGERFIENLYPELNTVDTAETSVNLEGIRCIPKTLSEGSGSREWRASTALTVTKEPKTTIRPASVETSRARRNANSGLSNS